MNFVQWVKGSTHCLGHTLDLILTYGLSVADVEFFYTFFSDHILVLFTTLLPSLPSITPNQVCWSRMLTAQSGTDFSNMYLETHQPFILDPIISHLSVDEKVNILNNRCSNILDFMAPRKRINLKRKTQPWINIDIQELRQQCRQCERKWNKDRLQVSYEMLKDSLHKFQKGAKAAKAKYLSESIGKNINCSRTLFSTVDSILNPSMQIFPEISPLLDFLTHFVDKVNNAKAQLAIMANPVLDPILFTTQWSEFELVTIQTCREITLKFKSTFSSF